MSRAAARAAKADEDDGVEGPLRRCIATGEVKSPERMVRFVIGPETVVVPDVAHKLPGRGYWVSAERSALMRAIDREAFSKAAKSKVVAEMSLVGLVENLLVRRCGDILGLSKRSGLVIQGYAKVEAVLRNQAGRIAALVEASESGDADRGKLLGYARRNGRIRVIGCLTESEIGLALGRENVVHAALSQGPLADRFVIEAERLGGFRVLCPAQWDAASNREGDDV